MTKTAHVVANGRGFWAYDVSASFLAYELLSVVREREPAWWTADLTGTMTGLAIVAGPVGLDLDAPVVEAGLTDEFEAVLVEARDRLLARGPVTEADAEARRTGGRPAIRRPSIGAALPAARIAEVADGVAGLLRGRLPHPPPGTWWFLGAPGDRRTISMIGSAVTG